MREISVAEQRYKAVLAVIADGRTVTEVARDLGVSRQALELTEFVDTEVSTEMRGGDAVDRTRALEESQLAISHNPPCSGGQRERGLYLPLLRRQPAELLQGAPT